MQVITAMSMAVVAHSERSNPNWKWVRLLYRLYKKGR